MGSVTMAGISKRFGSTLALEGLDMQIEAGELVCLLGPSGCGKTTALRILAGFERPDAGTIAVDGESLADVPTARRGFGMVFQDYSLFPNMTARRNIEFGLRVRRIGRAERDERVERLLAVTHLEPHAEKYPHQLSGGQKQRVALARALATQPRMLLLDEPLSALDAKVRDALREEIRRVQREFGVTTLLVTHDQHEALAIADRVGVMREGRLEQLDPPRDLYGRPRTPFVASFIGTVNLMPGLVEGRDVVVLGRRVATARPAVAGDVEAVVRPEQLAVDVDALGAWHVDDLAFLGPLTRVRVAGDAPRPLIADVLSTDAGRLARGDRVSLRLRDDVEEVTVL